MPIIYRPANKSNADNIVYKRKMVLTNKLNSEEKKQPVLVEKSNSVDKNKNKNNVSLSNKTDSNKKNKALVAGVKDSNNQSKSPGVDQLNNNKKIIIVNNKKSNGSQVMANLLKILTGMGLGVGGKIAYGKFFSEDKSGIIVNSDLVSYFRKKFDTKPKSWRFSPRYYFIKFLNMLFKYDSNKTTNEDITLMVKYGLLAFMPTSKNPIDEQMFGSLVSIILQELNYYSDFGYIVKTLIEIAGKDDAKFGRSWGTKDVKDIDFLKLKPNNSKCPPLGWNNNSGRLNWVVSILGVKKEKFGKYFDSISKNLVRYMNTVVDKCRDKTPENKLVLDVNDDPELSQANKDEIVELIKDNNICENVKRLIGLSGYQLALVFSNLIIRIAISQSFEIGLAETPKNQEKN